MLDESYRLEAQETKMQTLITSFPNWKDKDQEKFLASLDAAMRDNLAEGFAARRVPLKRHKKGIAKLKKLLNG